MSRTPSYLVLVLHSVRDGLTLVTCFVEHIPLEMSYPVPKRDKSAGI